MKSCRWEGDIAGGLSGHRGDRFHAVKQNFAHVRRCEYKGGHSHQGMSAWERSIAVSVVFGVRPTLHNVGKGCSICRRPHHFSREKIRGDVSDVIQLTLSSTEKLCIMEKLSVNLHKTSVMIFVEETLATRRNWNCIDGTYKWKMLLSIRESC